STPTHLHNPKMALLQPDSAIVPHETYLRVARIRLRFWPQTTSPLWARSAPCVKRGYECPRMCRLLGSATSRVRHIKTPASRRCARRSGRWDGAPRRPSCGELKLDARLRVSVSASMPLSLSAKRPGRPRGRTDNRQGASRRPRTVTSTPVITFIDVDWR